MINHFFSDLTGIGGVEAVVLFDNKNQVIDSWAEPKYNPAIFTEFGETFLHILGLIEYLKYEISDIAVPFDRGLVFAYTHPRFYLVVLGSLKSDISHIRLTANVA